MNERPLVVISAGGVSRPATPAETAEALGALGGAGGFAVPTREEIQSQVWTIAIAIVRGEQSPATILDDKDRGHALLFLAEMARQVYECPKGNPQCAL